MIRVVRDIVFEETVFFIALLAAVLTGIQYTTHWGAIDVSILMVLSTLMLIALAFEKYHLLDYFALRVIKKADSEFKTAIWMVLVTAFLAIWITNDVALITVVPITMKISKKLKFDPYRVIVLEAIAANIASSLTPFGNPQNLYLYNRYAYDLLPFMSVVFPFVLLGMLSLYIFVFPLNKIKMKNMDERSLPLNWKPLQFYLLAFTIAIVLIVLRAPMVWIFVPVTLHVLWKDRELFKKVDYFLIGTFVCFFIFVDHIEQMDWIRLYFMPIIANEKWMLYSTVALSQLISNVPAAMLLSAFTIYPDTLLLGVSIGGVGTMVASLANLIAFKFYAKAYDKKKYHLYFIGVNLTLLVTYLFVFGVIL